MLDAWLFAALISAAGVAGVLAFRRLHRLGKLLDESVRQQVAISELQRKQQQLYQQWMTALSESARQLNDKLIIEAAVSRAMIGELLDALQTEDTAKRKTLLNGLAATLGSEEVRTLNAKASQLIAAIEQAIKDESALPAQDARGNDEPSVS